ncbi:YkgJ family cysteine cluster protein [Vreelandella venusta]|uniref:YkgJ family cysteine cluster protein n=1 Tax=Vreelandella venusta TaxID=44935 RepID=A0AAP9ZH57_9GAMM|nr:YkgJ family cysteine cluster protein [Halomonas venusta]AZM95753.1 YkgJ family cysteine cluster protein [Halomonas venusta]NPT32786.1 zinc/iron-chelating domain-containing protein [Halomonas venusta]QRL04923.1 YkgJ family cysteine cluster protein [Halomonas venusta]UQI42391.1 YkgJ family cysteine cluster protein [Halomonas venusta]WAM53621.1 YkgJ family cysteine cluster protein [Halomonas venusta]
MSNHVFATTNTAACRAGCGACCIAPSISSYIPGMPNGKPAGVRCVQLSDNNLCRLFGDPSRPAVCERFDYDADVCGEHREEALATLNWLESTTR